MVEFIRDVVIVVALLVTLMAITLNPLAETDAPRTAIDQRNVGTHIPGPTASQAEPVVPARSTPQRPPE